MNLFKGSLCIMFSFLVIGGCASKNVGTSFMMSDKSGFDKSNPYIRNNVIAVNSKELKATIITPHMEEEIREGQNLLYCSTFQLAWNEFRDSCDTHLQDEPEVVKILDKKLATKEDISEDCYVAMAGLIRNGIVERINKNLKAKFKDEAWILDEDSFFGVTFLSYAFLFKNLIFKNEFQSLKHPIQFESNRETTKIRAFGIEKYKSDIHQVLGKQVSILDYKDDSNFIISLSSESPNDELILAKIRPQKSLFETIEFIEKRIKGIRHSSLKEGEILQIPKMNLDITHSYSEINNYISKIWPVGGTIQKIHFRLSEKGAVLKSEAKIIILECIRKHSRVHPRRFVFDKPFLIYSKEKGGKYPYFAMWVGNPELLVKAEE